MMVVNKKTDSNQFNNHLKKVIFSDNPFNKNENFKENYL